MTKAPPIDRFRKGEVVKVLDPLPGVPQGTRGRIYLIDGFTWTRYRVLFDNGVDIGSLDGSVLARPKQYDEALARRDAAAKAAAADGDEAAAAAPSAGEGGTPAASGDAGTPASGGEGKSAGGKKIPAHLLERSKRARDQSGGDSAASAPSDGGQAESPPTSEGQAAGPAASSSGDAQQPASGGDAASAAGSPPAGEEPASGGEAKTGGGKKIPAHLLERSKRARQQAG